MQKKKVKEHVTLLIGLGLVIAIFYITGIGCPIRWLTGISCAGCGLTRACLSALQLQFQDAFYYHPLFWVVPFVVIFYVLREKLPDKFLKGMMWTTVGAFIIVYLVRLFNPHNHLIEIDLKSGVIGNIISSFFN